MEERTRETRMKRRERERRERREKEELKEIQSKFNFMKRKRKNIYNDKRERESKKCFLFKFQVN